MKQNEMLILSAIGVLLIAIGLVFAFLSEAPEEKVVEKQGDAQVEEIPEIEPFLSPLYFTFVIHSEEDTHNCHAPKDQIPDYDGDEELLLHYTKAMRALGKMAQSHGVRMSFGMDWTFSNGVENFDSEFYVDVEAMGHEIDAHAHGSCIEYGEVRDEIIAAGGTPTTVASGINEMEIYDEMQYFDKLYPQITILWGVASAGHTDGEEMSSWVWRPSQDDWTTHDPDGKYIHVGHGDYIQDIDTIELAVESRRENAINTYAVFASVREFAPSIEDLESDFSVKPGDCMNWETKIAWWDAFFSYVDEFVDEGELEYATLSEIAEEFERVEDQLIFSETELPRSFESMTERSQEIGYCF